MDYREVTAVLHGSTLKSHSIDLANGRVELAPDGLPSIVFETVTILKWSGSASAATGMRVSVIGLERLGSGEPWGLYLKGENSGERELTCARVICDGAEVTGVGRSYRH